MDTAQNFLVEVRDRNFVRKGQIAAAFLDLKFTQVFRGIGSWELRLPAEHPLIADLKAKGSGIIITETWVGGSRIFSGRTRLSSLEQNAEDPIGTWTFSGADDGLVAAATVVYPDPANLSTAQTTGYWNLASNGETVMKQAVQLNAGSTAIVSRRYPWLTIAANFSRGAAASANARFDILGNLLQSLAKQSGLGWTFSQVGVNVVFDVFVPRNLTALIRLDIRNGGLDSSTLATAAPSATNVLVLGQGEGAARTVRPVTNSVATSEAALWGLRWESTKDQRNTNVDAELLNAGAEILNADSATINALKVVPSDAPGQRLGIDWGLGDTITLVVDGVEVQAIVSQLAIAVGPAGVLKQATVGDTVGYDWEAKVSATLKSQDTRLERLENYIDTPPPPPVAYVTPDTGWFLPTYATGWSQYVDPASGWAGVFLRVRDGVVYINGAAAKSSWSAGDIVLVIPLAYRPVTNGIQGVNCQARTNGNLYVSNAGTIAASFSLSYPIGA